MEEDHRFASDPGSGSDAGCAASVMVSPMAISRIVLMLAMT
jgi:hypothetical protein